MKETILLARHAEEVGLDVFAYGEHHNQLFWSSSPPVILSHVAALTSRLQPSTSAALITTNDLVRLAEEYALAKVLPQPAVLFGEEHRRVRLDDALGQCPARQRPARRGTIRQQGVRP